MNRMKTRKTIAGLAGLMLVALPLSACGDDSSDDNSSDSSSSSSESSGKVEALASIDDLANGKTTEIKAAPSFLETLDTLGVELGLYMKGKLNGDTLSFPITGGNVTLFEPGSVPNYVVGQVQHENSGITLTAGGKEITLANFDVDPGVSRVYGDVAVDGNVVATSVYLFRLDGSTLMPVQMEDNGDVILEGTQVFISDFAAGFLNDQFGIDDVTDQVLVGTAKITVGTK